MARFKLRRRTFPFKSLQYQYMHVQLFRNTVLAQTHKTIACACLVYRCSFQTTFPSATYSINAIKGANSTHVGDFVKTLVAGDRLPFLSPAQLLQFLSDSAQAIVLAIAQN